MARYERPSSSSSSMAWYLQYDIFLNFRGEDTRDAFTDFLYRKLKKHYHVFRDEEGIQCGENIAATLEKAIRESRLSVVVLSKDYASSTSCLNELETIMECYREGWHLVVPVFYHVDPHQVRHQEGNFAEPFVLHEKDYKRKNKVGPWRAALREIAGLNEEHVKRGTRKEHEIIQEIVEKIGNLIIGLERRENPIPTSDFVGQGFEKAKAKIWYWLGNDEVVKIGVYGMGGIGKTALVTHIYNQLLQKSDSSPIHLITVSQDFSTYKLLNLIAESVGLHISKKNDVKLRAAKFYEKLVRKQKLILILDDLWNHFDEEEVGIPLSLKGCKLIFTSRSRCLCKRMDCQEIRIEPLDDEEAWMLFSREIVRFDPNVEQEARLVASECAGLPLAIGTMGRCMRGVHDPCEWRNTLFELRESEIRNDDMEPEVFRILRFSYDRLKDSSSQQCFLCCSLFPEDFRIKREHLIKLLIAKGVIEQKRYKGDEIDKCHTMLNKLENLCLLEGCKDVENEECVKMHDLIRDMALQILRQHSPVMVRPGMQLEEFPDADEWEEDLETLSLMNNHIKQVTSGYSVMCSKLSTLLLCYNRRLTLIHDSFFQQFYDLKVLDLSETFIEILPSSISNLVRLTALLLRKCEELRHVWSLGNLQELKMLDLSYTRIEQVPHGMELLHKLKYLAMYPCSKLLEFPIGILPNLSHLESLRLDPFRIVRGEEMGGLKRLKYLECGFDSVVSFNNICNCRTVMSSTISRSLCSQDHIEISISHLGSHPIWLYYQDVILAENSINFQRALIS